MSGQQRAPQRPTTFGRYAEIPPAQFSPEQKEAYDYILRERGMCPGPYRIRPLWNVMLIAALGYYIGWWLPWPIFGYHAPNEFSQIDHFTATVITLVGVYCARQQFPKTPTP